MKIPAKSIAAKIEASLKKDIHELKHHGVSPYLVDFLIGNSQELIAICDLKKKQAQKLGIKYECIHKTNIPIFEKFAQLLKEQAARSEVTGITIQQPLPPQLQTDSIYKYIPVNKEIEGHVNKSPFLPPIGMAVLSVLKYIYSENDKNKFDTVVIDSDGPNLRKILKHKRIVLVGRGITGGQPIGKTLSQLKINYLSLNSGTHEPEQYYCEADILITAVGKNIITRQCLKPGVAILNFGLHTEGGIVLGDYKEEEVSHLASYYTSPATILTTLEILYLYKNLIDSAKKQAKM